MKTDCGSSPESSTGKETPNYNPFGAEWESEMFNFKKYELIEILRGTLKNRFTKEQVEELLKKQREICADIACVFLPSHPHLHLSRNVNTVSIANAPSPSLEGEKK